MASTPLAELERCRLEFGAGAADRKLRLLKTLARTRLGSAHAVRRLHELLCVLRAYPDNAKLLATVCALLERFAVRADLRAHREALADTGIAGTDIRYRFFAGQAQWLAAHWPGQLRLDRSDAEAEARIASALPTLLTRAEASALAELKLPGYEALDCLRGADTTDAAFLLRRIAAMPGDGFTREAFSDTVDASYLLLPGPGTPSRSTAHFAAATVVWRRQVPPRSRPDLRAELARRPRALRRLPLSDAQVLVDLARAAMVTRARSLEAFSFADVRDAWWVDDGDGLAYAFFGMQPERRHPLAAIYGGLMLRNGVPIGYLQSDHVGRSAALSFNTFDSFRGIEAGFTFARWLAALRRLFGSTSFSIEPYQLGWHNDEAVASGAWWFYAKLGFAPRDAAVARLARAEAERQRRDPRHRSGADTLRRLAARHLFFDVDPTQALPYIDLAGLGLRSGATLSARTAADRESGVEQASAELVRHAALVSWRGFTPAQREAWRRLAPLLVLLDLDRWSVDERLALVDLARAKGGRSERDFVERYALHPRLDAEMRRGPARAIG
jgi:hypothetical protein